MDQEAFAELGLEGLDRFATKYHDKVIDKAPVWRQRKHDHEHHPEKYARDERKARNEREYQSHQRARSNPPDPPRNDYIPDRSAVRPREVDNYSSTPRTRDRDFKETYPPPSAMSDRSNGRAPPLRDGDLSRYRTAERARDPYPTARDPYHSTYYPGGAPPASAMRNPYPADSVVLERSRYDHRRHSRSRSRSRSHPRQRPRSNSETKSSDKDKDYPYVTKHRYTPTLVGAVAGGLAGRNVSDGDRLSTVIGAVVGAIGAKQGYKTYEKRKEKKNRKEDREWEEKHGGGSEDDYSDEYEGERAGRGKDSFRGGRDGRVRFSRSRSR